MNRETVDVGWRPDPYEPGRDRWWDGLSWTEFSRESPVRAPLHQSQPYEPQRVLPSRDSSPYVWWLVGTPTVSVMTVVIVSGFAMVVYPLQILLVAVGPILLIAGTFVLAVMDRDTLRAGGIWNAPSPFFVLLTSIVYLALRWRVVRMHGQSGALPLVLFVLQLAGIGGANFLLEGFSGLSVLAG